jgi:hypothetical protein
MSVAPKSAVPARTIMMRVNMNPNDQVERPRDDLWRAADVVGPDKLGIVRLALLASRTAPTDG